MRRFCSMLALLLVSSLALTQERTTPKPRGPMDDRPVNELPPGKIISRQELGQNTTLARLGNGMTVIIREHHVAPVATARVYVSNTGSAYEGRYLGAGISHLVEHLVSGGSTKNRGEKQIEELLSSLGASSNAYTSTDVTNYYINCPARHVRQAIAVLADAMQHCIFPEAEFNREYLVVQRELEMGEEERESVMWHLQQQLAYREHPLRHPVIGYLPVLQALTRDDVVRFYQERYQPQHMTFVVVGDVKTDAVLDEIAKQFATFKRTAEVTVPMPVEPPLSSPRQARRAMEGELCDATLAWPTVGLEHPDLYPLDLASFILGNGDSSRLSRKLRFQQNLVPSISSSSFTPPGVAGWFQVSLEAEPKNLTKALEEAAREVYQLRDQTVTAAELAKAKKQMIAAHVFGQQSVEQLAESLSSSYRGTGDPLFDTYYAQRIQKVTAEDIQRVARVYFTPERLMTAVIDPVGTAKPQAAAGGAVEEGKIEKHKLPNGVTVLLKRSTAAPLVHMQCIVRAGTLAETDAANGVADLTAELMTRGTRKYTADQIAEYFDSIGGSIAAAGGRNLTYVACEVLKDDFDRAFDYFTQVALQPVFPADEFTARKEEALLNIGQRKADTFAEAMEFFYDTLPQGTALRRMRGGRKETVAKLTVEDCRKFHAAHFVPQNMVVTVVGDIDTAKALAMVKAQFGSLPPAPNFKPPTGAGLTLTQPIVAHKPTRRPDTAVIVLAYPATDIFQHEDNAALAVLKAILAGHDNGGGWLFRDLRGAGLVYVVQAMQVQTLVPGYLMVLAQTRPEQLPEALRRIKDNLAKAARGEITEAEFTRAREAVINAHALENETLAERAALAGFSEALGLGYDDDDKFEGRIAAVTLDDVRRVAKKYLTHHVQVTTGLKAGTE